ncbi:DUF1259 domain-containing protein [Ferruginibacter sp.]|uniref:DUF1259 domain-containing protein n=1 Tax=Ferruginibacter sp. TaxID=1940288 RepID=UPI00374D01F8
MKQVIKINAAAVFIIACLLMVSCNDATKTQPVAENKKDTIACKPESSKLDTVTIAAVTGMKGTVKNGEYKITVPQNDLHIVVDGFKIIPPMGLGTWIAFTPCGDSVMMMGDIILSENDVAPVQQEVIRQGLSITAIHNHFVRNRPNVMYMHIDGFGNAATLAANAKAILDKVSQVRGADPKAARGDSVVNTLNISLLDSLMAHKGEMNKGVYKFTIGRPDVMLREHGVPISTFMGFNTWAAWQGTPERAAVAGDFAMLMDEVQPVIKTLIENGIEVVAVHNHMVHEEPKIFFLHYWGVGPAEKLAKGLKAALDKTGKGMGH